MAPDKKKPRSATQKRLIALRNRLGLTNEEMAARVGVSKRAWVAWIYGENSPPPTALTLISLIERGKI